MGRASQVDLFAADATDTARARGIVGVDLVAPVCMRSAQTPQPQIAVLVPGQRLFSLTMGLYSLSDLIGSMCELVGGRDVSVMVSTWTVGVGEAAALGRLLRSGVAESVTVMVDRSWPSRKRDLCAALVKAVGVESIRLMRTHAKVLIVSGPRGVVAAHGSLNMNPNARCESICVEYETEPARWMETEMRTMCEALPNGLTVDEAKIRAIFASFGVDDAREFMTDDEFDAMMSGTGDAVWD